jgi:23S rRNA (uracil1939-C5)-methyltransferase
MKVVIDRLGMNGEGVARCTDGKYKDKVCFVPLALPNEEVDVEIIEDKKKFSIARLGKIFTQSEHRVIPPCKYFGICGGCDIQHMDKHCQLDYKKSKVDDAITRIAGVNTTINPVVRLNDFSYRNKMVFPIINDEKTTKIGMFSAGSHSIVEIEKCMLCKDIINDVLSVTKEFLKSSTLIGYNFKCKKGDVKYLVVRVHNNSILVTIVATKKVDLFDYYNLLSEKFKNIGLSLVISNSENDIMSGEYVYIAGLEALEIDEFGIKYYVDNRGFLQVNDDIKNKLYGQVLNEIYENDCVIDCYSGAGLLSAIISKKCSNVIGIEINKSASNSAKNLAKTNNLQNIQFINDDVKNCIENVLENNKNCVVVLDPPRSGCDKQILENIIKSSVKKIIYISCNPSTLARDLAILKKNYNTTSVTPWDMFPNTKHVESLVVLERKEF